MSANLARLRNLGGALGEEITEQNKVLDRLAVKTDKADTVVRKQDNQMKKLLNQSPEDEKSMTDSVPGTTSLASKFALWKLTKWFFVFLVNRILQVKQLLHLVS